MAIVNEVGAQAKMSLFSAYRTKQAQKAIDSRKDSFRMNEFGDVGIVDFKTLKTYGNVDFKDLKVNLAAVKDAAVSVVSEGAAPSEPVYWNYGAFIQQCIDFAILAFCVFLLVKLMNKLSTIKKKEEEVAPAPEPAPEPAPSNEEVLLAEIRDLLKEKK